jgi:hypothetical protein
MEFSKDQSLYLMKKYPNCVPIILECDHELKNTKLIMDKDYNVSQLMLFIRKKNKLNKFEAYYIFINNLLIKQTECIGDLYVQFANSHGFLYITIKKENTFG